MSALLSLIRSARRALGAGADGLRAASRVFNGDAAYAQYLVHWHDRHGTEDTPLDRAEFFRQETERRWNGVRRCC